jgi:hypothetical protein
MASGNYFDGRSQSGPTEKNAGGRGLIAVVMVGCLLHVVGAVAVTFGWWWG